jgi:peroxiredoxin
MRYAGLILLSCAFLAGEPASRPSRELTIATKINDGAITIRLRNEYSVGATAWIVECHAETASGDWTSQWHWSDQELGLEGKPIEPGGETEFKIPPRPSMMNKKQSATPVSCEDYQVKAAVFADGTVSGEFLWIAAVAGERHKAYEDLAKATDILKKAMADGDERTAVEQKLADWQSSEGQSMRPGTTSPRVGDGNSWRTAGPSTPHESFPMARPQARAAVPSAALWLLRTKKKDLPEAVKLLSEWRARLKSLGQVKESAGFMPPLTTTRTTPGRVAQPELVGKPAPDFTLKNVDGRELALKDLRGKTVLLDFWATWCEPCRKDMPEIKNLHDEFKSKGLEVVLIDFSEPAEVAKEYFEKNKYTFHNLLDPQSETFDKYGAGGIPKVVLIDKDGVVRYCQLGYSSRQDFRAEVQKLGL